jgi:hypothetical protein
MEVVEETPLRRMVSPEALEVVVDAEVQLEQAAMAIHPQLHQAKETMELLVLEL